MAKYKRRKDGLYQANVQIGINPSTGKQKFKTVYAHTIDELELARSEVKKAVKEGRYSDDRGMLIKDWAKEWYELYHSTDAVRTAEMYYRLVHSYIIPGLGHVRLKNLKKSDIQKFINSHWDIPRTCEQLIMCLKQILNSAIEESLLYKNVCKKISLPICQRKEQRALTPSEKQAIKYAFLTLKQTVFIRLLELCGLRLGEVLALNKSSFDLSKAEVYIKKAITFSGNTPILKDPKTKYGYRTLDLPDLLINLLKEYFKTINHYLFELERVKRKSIVTLPDCSTPNFMTKSSYRKFWNNIVQAFNNYLGAQVQQNDLTSRTFRYNFATILYYSGTDPKEAQRIMGHSDIKIMLDIYAALDPVQSDSKNKVQNYLNTIYDPVPEEKTSYESA